MKKRLLSILLCLVMALSLVPTAFAAGSYNAVKDGWAEGASANKTSQALKVWKGTDGNYYLAVASDDGKNKIDSNFESLANAAVANGDYHSVSYIRNNSKLVVMNGDNTVYNKTPSEATGKNSNIWVILCMSAEKFNSYENTTGAFEIPLLNAGGFAIGEIKIDPTIKEQIKEDISYSLSYDLNGGTGSFSKQSKITTDDSYTFTVSTAQPTREGYTFKGWATTAGATTANVDTTVTATKDNRDVTIYAVWEEISTYTYTLKYDLNGGSGSFSDATYTGTDESHSFTVSTATPTKTGYTFKGWATTAGATTANVDTSVTVTKSSPSATIYAVWEIASYDVIYKVDGEVVGEAVSHNYGDTVTVLPTYVKPGYTVTPWTSEDVSVAAGSFTMPTKDVVINATSTVNSYDVIYKVDGEVVYTDSYDYDELVTVRDAYAKEGYDVTDWDTTDDFNMPAENVVIEATSSINSYTVTYFVDGEQVGEVETYNFGEAVTVRPTYIKEGYTVSDWNKTDFTMPAADVEIYATSHSNERPTPDPVDPVDPTPAPTPDPVDPVDSVDPVDPAPAPAPAPAEKTVDPDVPNTGDHMSVALWCAVMCFAVTGMAVTVVCTKKKNEAE